VTPGLKRTIAREWLLLVLCGAFAGLGSLAFHVYEVETLRAKLRQVEREYEAEEARLDEAEKSGRWEAGKRPGGYFGTIFEEEHKREQVAAAYPVHSASATYGVGIGLGWPALYVLVLFARSVVWSVRVVRARE
jgi:hypothetical protein